MRSYNWYPFCVTISTVLAGCSAEACCITAWWTWGSKGACRASIRLQWWRCTRVLQLLLDHLEAVQEGRRVGILLRRLDRPLDVVQRRHQVAQQRHVGIAEFVFEFAGGPLAIIVQLRVAADLAVLGGFQLGTQLANCVFRPGSCGRLRRRLLRLGRRSSRRSCRFVLGRVVFRHGTFSESHRLRTTSSACRKNSFAWQ